MSRFETDKNNYYLDNRGFTLMEQVIVLAIIGIIISLSASFLPQIVGTIKKANSVSNLNILSSRLARVIRDTTAWSNTLTNNGGPVFDCWNNNTDCAAVPTRAFSPYQPDGSLLQILDSQDPPQLQTYNPANNPTHGFSLEGKFCNTYGAGDPRCPVRVDFTWTPLCPPSGPCYRPPSRVQMTFSFSLPAGVNPPIPPAAVNRTIDLVGQSQVAVAGSCPTFTDSYGTITQMVLIGINPDGTLRCMDGQALFGPKSTY